MRLTKLSITDFKKIESVNIDIPIDNQVICFVGENGANKSSVMSYVYNLIKSTTSLESPSCSDDLFYENTSDASANSEYCLFSLEVAHNSKTYTANRAIVRHNITLSAESVAKLTPLFGHLLDTYLHNPFLLNFSNDTNDDYVADSVLLYRPTNRCETPLHEKPVDVINRTSGTFSVLGKRKLPFRVDNGLAEAEDYIFDFLLDHMIAMANKEPKQSLYPELVDILSSINPEFINLNVTGFPHRSISSHNLPTLSSLSSGQSDWFITAIYTLLQAFNISTNGKSGINDMFNVSGIVFIDEVDKNYHPSLQERFLPWITNKFKNIQFIVSTHSPYVVRSLPKDSIVVKLPDGELVEEDFSYMSISEVSSRIFCKDLGFTEKVNKMIDKYESLLTLTDSSSEDEAFRMYLDLTSKSSALRDKIKGMTYLYGSPEYISRLNDYQDNNESL